MEALLSKLVGNITITNRLEDDISRLFQEHGLTEIAEHSIKVAYEAQRLGADFGMDVSSAMTCGYLHDLGRLIPQNEAVHIATQLGIKVLEEEASYPDLLHQKTSKVLATEIFGIQDQQILAAIECHTTLRAGATDFDLILLIADKLSWDSSDSEPILQGIQKGLEKSLQHGAFYYLNHLYENRDKINVLHPWVLEAYRDLKEKCTK